jgi:hypothetical protein
MSTFALPPLRLPFTGLRAVKMPAPALRPVHEPVEHALELDETWRPVPASTRDITIPDLMPPERASWRRPRAVRRRAS